MADRYGMIMEGIDLSGLSEADQSNVADDVIQTALRNPRYKLGYYRERSKFFQKKADELNRERMPHHIRGFKEERQYKERNQERAKVAETLSNIYFQIGNNVKNLPRNS